VNLTDRFDSALDELVDNIRQFMVVIYSGRHGAGAGILADEGLVLTNAHVVRHNRKLRVVLDDDREYEGQLIAQNPEIDLALLRIPKNGYQTAVFSPNLPRPGEIVFAFGHPWGMRNILTAGVLSSITSAKTAKRQVTLLRSDLQLAPGNSGGPLLNAAGEVVGLNAMIFGGDQSLAIAVTEIRAFMEQSGVKKGILA
jgi:serine protease Do